MLMSVCLALGVTGRRQAGKQAQWCVLTVLRVCALNVS